MAIVFAEGRTLETLARDELLALLRRDGAVVLRGFAPTVSGYATLMRRLLTRLKHTPVHRRTHPLSRVVQSVTPGMQPQSFHAEYAHLPDRVGVISFWCETPGGETRFCDGAAVWNALDATTRTLLTAQRIRYTAWHDASAWVAACGSDDIAAIQRGAATIPGYRVEPGPGGGLLTELTTWAFTTPAHVGAPCLSANVLPGAYAALAVTLEDGSALPVDVVADISRAADSSAEAMVWEPGDVLLLDNVRMMHARGEQSSRRKCWAILGYT